MALFGNRKDANDWIKFREKETSNILAEKLKKEQTKRQAAEKEVARLKEEVKILKKLLGPKPSG